MLANKYQIIQACVIATTFLVVVPNITGGGTPNMMGGDVEIDCPAHKIEAKNIKTTLFDYPLIDCFDRGEGEILHKTTLATASVMAFDYDNDGDMDFTANTLLYINHDGGYEAVEILEEDIQLRYGGTTHADFNNDGKEDFIAGGIEGVIRLFINNCSGQDGDPKFEMNEVANFSGHRGCAYGVTAADFNHDGNMDFAVSYSVNMDKNKIVIFYSDGNAGFIQKDVYIMESDNDEIGTIRDLESGDFDNDGDIDIIFTYDTTKWCGDLLINTQGVASILFNNGKNNFGNETTIAIRGCPILIGGRYVLLWKEFLTRIGFDRINPQLTSADYDMDGDIDFLWGDNSGKVEIFENDGTGNFTSSGRFIRGIIHDFGRASWGLDSADFDSDGDIDFIVVAANMKELRGYAYLKRNQIKQ